MKIRRALTAAAAAAVIAPAAVLAAPTAAFATDPVPGTSPRTSATPGTPDTPDTAKPAQPPTDAPANGGGTADPDDTANGGSAPRDHDGDAGKPRKTTGTGGTGSAAGGGEEAGDPDGQSCAFESDQLRVAVHGVPARLTAGGAWSPFSMTLANTTGKALGEVQPFLYVASAEDVDRPYWELDTEYRDARTGRWKTFHDAEPQDLYGSFAIGPHSTVTLQLRTRVVKTAETGAGYMLAAGDYRNRDGSCGSSKEAWYDFTILPAGTKPTQSPSAEPSGPGGSAEPSPSATPGGGTGGSAATGGPGPQGGNLAETGSSSALPAIGLAAGAAVVAGAAAVFAVRRRKAMAGAGGGDTDVTA
ncbi:LAETG motif-containing sortase-dependent surface protein [Streptomyces sp. enrichment culture]|uniref:LAETG motif-containing sortase-dependent surface protein n=1 Tax=Streptomyces sp. enrichment culture TaxID=1795815 RepID=UPI003F56DBE3